MKDKPVFWKQANGTFIDVNSMDVHHLRNVLKMILSTTNKRVYSGIIVQAESHIDKCDDADHHEFESNLGFNFNDLSESMDMGNNELGHY